MNTNVLSRSDRESVAILTFERPAKLNALNYELVDSIVQALDQIETEDQIRAVVLTGSGRAFSAGADIHEFSQDVKLGPQIAHRKFVRRGQNMTKRIENFSKPVIAAVNGIAYGGGCEIVEATHLSIAVPEARLVGRKRALRMILTGEPITASEAKAAGLINEVVDKERLLEEAVALGLKIAGFAPEAVAICLHAVHRGLNTTIDEGLAIEAEAFARMVPTTATREALNKFIESHSQPPIPTANGRE